KNVSEAMGLTQTEWRRMRDHGVTRDELINAKTFLVGSYPLRFTDSVSLAGTLVSYQYAKLPIDYFQKRQQLIESYTDKDINLVAKNILDPESLVFAIVGPHGVENTQNLKAGGHK